MISDKPPADAATVSFTATFFKDTDGTLKFRTENAKDASRPAADLSGRDDLRRRGCTSSATSIRVGDAPFPFVQYNPTGKDGYADRTRKPWRDYHGDWLFNEATKKLTIRRRTKSFEIECASCHFTGYTLTPTVGGEFVAGAVNDPNGEADIDGDGVPNELNLGCEELPRPRLRAREARRERARRPPSSTRRKLADRAGHGHLQPVPQPAPGQPEERPAGEQGEPDADPGASAATST